MTGSVQKESNKKTMRLTGKISSTETSCHPLEKVNLNFIFITILHLKEREMRKWGLWRHILAVRFWLLLCRTVKTTLIQPASDSNLASNSDSDRVEHIVGSSSNSSELNDSGDQAAGSEQEQEAEETILETWD